MFHPRSLRRGAIATVLFSMLALTSAIPGAAEPSGPYRQEVAAAARYEGLFARLWHMMTSLWGSEGTATDPNGVPIPPPIPHS
jgi:hypothetical protein